jgi:hypothetical protein
MSGGNGGIFGNITITNGKGNPLGTNTTPPATVSISEPTPTTSPTPVPTPEPTPAITTSPTPDPIPDFSNIKITGGTVVYLNPDFSGIKITFGYSQ